MAEEPRRPGAWRPLLEGTLADRAREAIEAIADEIDEHHQKKTIRTGAEDPSIDRGMAGLAVLRAYVFRAFGREVDADLAERTLDFAVSQVTSAPLTASLYSGFPGVAWGVEHLCPGGDDPNEAVDEALLDYLDASPWPGDYDLISGLVGVGVYALERLPRSGSEGAVAVCLARVLDRLDELGERSAAGTTWFTRPKLAPGLQGAPQGYYNLGLAHGVPGVIALLGGLCRAGIERARARDLLEGAARWLLAQALPGGEGFPYWVGPGVAPRRARAGWCYGDPGVAGALFAAARATDEPDWEREALAIAWRAAARPRGEAGVFDAALCHGAAGLGHIYNRMAQATGDERLFSAARAWFEHTLDLRRPGQGIGGFISAIFPDGDDSLAWVADPSLLSGAAGIALALLSAISPIEPAWDRLLLLSTL